MAKKTGGNKVSHSHVCDDWFYLVLVILIGIILLFINLELLSSDWIAYWPALLIVVGVKEILERD